MIHVNVIGFTLSASDWVVEGWRDILPIVRSELAGVVTVEDTRTGERQRLAAKAVAADDSCSNSGSRGT